MKSVLTDIVAVLALPLLLAWALAACVLHPVRSWRSLREFEEHLPCGRL